MFTRDIALEDCILDLVDNSVDALLRTRDVNIEQEVLAPGIGSKIPKRERAHIRVDYSDRRFQIADNCGGIAFEDAQNEVFCFGHGRQAPKGRLGVYGIGLKRAIFRLVTRSKWNQIRRTPHSGLISTYSIGRREISSLVIGRSH